MSEITNASMAATRITPCRVGSYQLESATSRDAPICLRKNKHCPAANALMQALACLIFNDQDVGRQLQAMPGHFLRHMAERALDPKPESKRSLFAGTVVEYASTADLFQYWFDEAVQKLDPVALWWHIVSRSPTVAHDAEVTNRTVEQDFWMLNAMRIAMTCRLLCPTLSHGDADNGHEVGGKVEQFWLRVTLAPGDNVSDTISNPSEWNANEYVTKYWPECLKDHWVKDDELLRRLKAKAWGWQCEEGPRLLIIEIKSPRVVSKTTLLGGNFEFGNKQYEPIVLIKHKQNVGAPTYKAYVKYGTNWWKAHDENVESKGTSALKGAKNVVMIWARPLSQNQPHLMLKEEKGKAPEKEDEVSKNTEQERKRRQHVSSCGTRL